MRIALVVLTFSAAMFGPASVPAASAFDVTGHWVGKWSCKGFSAPFTDDNGKLHYFESADAAAEALRELGQGEQ